LTPSWRGPTRSGAGPSEVKVGTVFGYKSLAIKECVKECMWDIKNYAK
jgi:hypothetical protein